MRVNTNTWNRLRYDFYAPFYDLVAKQLDRGRRRSIELAELKVGERVLIAGAGTGLDFPFLPRGVSVEAVDLAPKMIQQAERRADRLGIDVRCRVMDAHHLTYPDASFDAVLLHLILAVIPDPIACASEAARVLKPNGRVAIFDKFLPDDASPSVLRRGAGVVANVFFSDINRKLGPVVEAAGLGIVYEEPSLLGGVFKVAVVRKA